MKWFPPLVWLLAPTWVTIVVHNMSGGDWDLVGFVFIANILIILWLAARGRARRRKR